MYSRWYEIYQPPILQFDWSIRVSHGTNTCIGECFEQVLISLFFHSPLSLSPSLSASFPPSPSPFLSLSFQYKHAREEIDVPSEYHPFLSGPSGSIAAGIMERTSVKINMPPLSSKKSGITIVGEREGIAKAKDELMKIYTNAVSRRKCMYTCTLYEWLRTLSYNYCMYNNINKLVSDWKLSMRNFLIVVICAKYIIILLLVYL